MTDSRRNLVRVHNVDKVFKRGSETIHVLGGLDLEIPEGEFLALVPSLEQVVAQTHFREELRHAGVTWGWCSSSTT